jgi:hypothetical protein
MLDGFPSVSMLPTRKAAFVEQHNNGPNPLKTLSGAVIGASLSHF